MDSDSELGSVQMRSIQIFCKAAEMCSFTEAAKALGLTPAAVSRSVARTEERLRVQLFARTTRQIKITEDGLLYFERCRDAIQQIEDVERALSGSRSIPSGTLKISAPTTYGHFRLLPMLEKFHQTYPQVSLDINLSNRNIDFVDQGYDVAIRLGTPQDSRLVARQLEAAPLGVYASPAYLERRGTPGTLADLSHHNCIQFVLPSTGRPLPWIFRDGPVDVELTPGGPVRFSEDVLGCVGYATAGGGLVQTYDFIASGPQYGGLVEVLTPYRGRSRPFCVLYPHNRHLSANVRAFVDLLAVEVETLRARTRLEETA